MRDKKKEEEWKSGQKKIRDEEEKKEIYGWKGREGEEKGNK